MFAVFIKVGKEKACVDAVSGKKLMLKKVEASLTLGAAGEGQAGGGVRTIDTACNQFPRPHREKSIRPGMDALTVGSVLHTHTHASVQGASKQRERMRARNCCSI